MWLVLVAAAAAAVPDGIRPAIVGVNLPAEIALRRQAERLPPDPLACEPLWPGTALLCYRVWEDGRRRWVVRSDLDRWTADLAALRQHVTKLAEEKLKALETVPIGGMSASYLRIVDGDGWAAAGLLRPDLLAAKAGGLPVRVAVPSDAVLLAWKGGDPQVDHVMAVGAREIFDQQPVKVTPHVWQWDGRVWTPYGEAIPKVVPPG